MQKVSTLKILQCCRETNTPHVFRLDIGLDTPRFPGHDVACSTKVIVTADVSTVTDTPPSLSSSAVTSQSRGTQVADDVINSMFVSPTTETGMKPDVVCRDSDDGNFSPITVFRSEVSESASCRKFFLNNSTAPTVTASVSPVVCTTSICVGTQYPSLEYLNVGTDTSQRSFANDGTNTAIVTDIACNTVDWRNETAGNNTTTHVETNTEAISLICRRANSLPPRPELTRTNQGPPGAFVELFPVLPPVANIPDSTNVETYQPEEQVDRIHDDGSHVINRKHVPVGDGQLCQSCRRPMVGETSALDGSDSLVNNIDSVSDDGKLEQTDEGRGQKFQEFPVFENTEAVPDSRATTYQDRAVGNEDPFPVVENRTYYTNYDKEQIQDFYQESTAHGQSDTRRITYQDQTVGKDDALAVVERGVGSGTAWTDTRGTGCRSVWTADAETWTPAVSVLERGVGTRSVRLVHKNEATDSQQTVSVATSPAEDITSTYRGLLAAAQPRAMTVNRGTATPPAPVTVDQQTTTEHRRLVDSATSPAVDVAAAYRGLLDARVAASTRLTISRGTLTAPVPGTSCEDKDTITDCIMVDRASSPVKVQFLLASMNVQLFIAVVYVVLNG